MLMSVSKPCWKGTSRVAKSALQRYRKDPEGDTDIAAQKIRLSGFLLDFLGESGEEKDFM